MVFRRKNDLAKLQDRLRRARAEAEVAAEQALALREEADDLRVRALASDRPDDRADAAEAERHAVTAEAARDRARAEAARLVADIDAALDRRSQG
ncbi:MAG TPA: hypothetical protein VHN98_07035 [Acidimicrobiales bacterium]|nr:hypothetical protein [Acidimicrobiales bacterium]